MNLNLRSILLLLVALGVAGVTTFVARSWLSTNTSEGGAERTAATAEAKLEILVAKANIPTGTLLKPEHLRWQTWPENALSDTYIQRKDKKIEDFLGKGAVARQSITAGEPITDLRVVKADDQGFMAAVLPANMRAVTVAVTATSGVAGFVFPGDRVDVILSHKIRRSKDEVRLASETVLSNVRVLALDQKTDYEAGAPQLAKTATLEVTPKQVERINVARQLGALSLSLRPLEVAGGAPGETGADGEPTPTSSVSHTWDSEVSRLLPPVDPGNRNLQQVRLARGEKTANYTFRRSDQ